MAHNRRIHADARKSIARAVMATEPVNLNPPCNKRTLELKGKSVPVMDRYFVYHFESSMHSLAFIEALGSLEMCKDVVQRAEAGMARRKAISRELETAPEPYKQYFSGLLSAHNVMGIPPKIRADSMQGRVDKLVASKNMTPPEACALLWGETQAMWLHNYGTFSNRFKHELPKCQDVPSRPSKLGR